ncbi:hypothetical protein K449DRAFT_468692 [Hypoxylon sp. EC38]|nr:hypothetical protein K449DRAFT_468692 [Hypoxylon sp. EC38]
MQAVANNLLYNNPIFTPSFRKPIILIWWLVQSHIPEDKVVGQNGELPDDDDPLFRPKVFLHQPELYLNSQLERDVERIEYEEYLRLKWGCNEAVPEDFDPDNLEIDSQARLKRLMERQEAVRNAINILSMSEPESFELNTDVHYQEKCERPNNLYSGKSNASSESVTSSVSVAESLDSDERLQVYENEAVINVASVESLTRMVSPDPTVIRRSMAASIERIPTPRIRAGSRPPLSRSAYSPTAIPTLRDGYTWKRPSITLKDYPRAPDYFPFNSSVA